jgi:hypothetical protein
VTLDWDMHCNIGSSVADSSREDEMYEVIGKSVGKGPLGRIGTHERINDSKSVDKDSLCGLVVRVLDYRCRGPGFDSRALQKKK